MTLTQKPAAALSAVPGGSRLPLWRRRSWLGACAAFLIGLLASIALYHSVWADPTASTVGTVGHVNDQMQSMWFLKWVPWRLWHGHNPFRTTAIDYPAGVNLAWNTSTPTLGLLAAPLTFTAGAAVTYNLLLLLAPALTTLTGYLWLRRHVDFEPAAVIGALVIAFGPFEAAHLWGHLHLAFAALLPLMLLFFEDLLWRRPRPQWRTALYLGVITAAQFGISEEMAVLTVLVVVLALAFHLLGDARGVLTALRTTAGPLAAAVGVVVVLAAPLLYMQFLAGDNLRIYGEVWRAQPGQYVWPTHNQAWHAFSHAPRTVGEDAEFVGILMLAVLAIGVLACVRDRRVRTAVLSAAVLVLLTFGDVNWLGIPMPWHYLRKLPGFEAVLPLRIAFAWWLVVAWLVAVFVDRLSRALRSADARTRAASGVALTGIAVGLLTWVPPTYASSQLPRLPRYLAAPHPELPRGSVVLLLPLAVPNDDRGMYLQEEATFWFNQPGGYAYRNAGPGYAVLDPGRSPLVRTADHVTRQYDYPLAPAIAELRRLRYRAIVVVQGLATSSADTDLAVRLTGRGPDLTGPGVQVWLLSG